MGDMIVGTSATATSLRRWQKPGFATGGIIKNPGPIVVGEHPPPQIEPLVVRSLSELEHALGPRAAFSDALSQPRRKRDLLGDLWYWLRYEVLR